MQVLNLNSLAVEKVDLSFLIKEINKNRPVHKNVDYYEDWFEDWILYCEGRDYSLLTDTNSVKIGEIKINGKDLLKLIQVSSQFSPCFIETILKAFAEESKNRDNYRLKAI